MQEDETAIRTIVEKWKEAVRARDYDALMSNYAEDVVVFDVPPPIQVKGRDAYRKRWEHWLGGFKGEVGCEMREVEITVSGDLAYLHALTQISDRLAGGTGDGPWVRATVCYAKADGRWLVTHEHVSIPAGG